MKRTCKSEWFVLDRPLEESDILHTDKEYHIERTVNEEGTIIWWGHDTNWKKEKEGSWTKLVEGEFVECEAPVYEKLLK